MKRKNDARSAAEEAAMDHANVLNPVIGISMGDLAKVGLSVLREALLQPTIGIEHAAKLAQENVRVAFGTSELSPHRRDRRFADPAFATQPVYKRVAQSWLALEKTLQQWSDATGLQDTDRERARFMTCASPEDFGQEGTFIKRRFMVLA